MEIVTIGLPVYNAELFLKDAIQSILNQTYENFKLLVVDDGSTDSSIEIVNSFKDSRIELIGDNENHGLAYRLNQIAQLTKTKYLARMDSDDIMHPERIANQIKILEANPEIDVLGTNVLSIDEHNVVHGVRYIPLELQLIDCKSFVHPSIMAKTIWFIENPYNIKLIRAQDAELWNRTSANSNFKLLMLPLLFYREIGSRNYRKYFKGMPSMLYLIRKRKSIEQVVITTKYFSKGLIYYFYYLFGKESKLISRRNHVFSQKEKYQSILVEAIS